MKLFLALLIAALFLLMAEGALAVIVPPPWCPDLGLLAIVSVGLRWRGLAWGLVFAYILGSAADVMSGSLMGLHALLSTFVFMAAVFAGRQLNLKGSFPLVAFTGFVSFSYGLAVYGISRFFIGGIEFSLSWVLANFVHALVNGLLAPLAYAGFSRLAVWAGATDASERALYIENPGRPA